jgi:hypothetical protein
VALAGSVEVSVFIWERTSRSWVGGRVLRVREMASGQLSPGGRSTPRGRGGREEFEGAGIGGGIEKPFGGIGLCW